MKYTSLRNFFNRKKNANAKNTSRVGFLQSLISLYWRVIITWSRCRIITTTTHEITTQAAKVIMTPFIEAAVLSYPRLNSSMWFVCTPRGGKRVSVAWQYCQTSNFPTLAFEKLKNFTALSQKNGWTPISAKLVGFFRQYDYYYSAQK